MSRGASIAVGRRRGGRFWQAVIVVASFAPLLTIGALLGTILLVARRSWAAAAIGAVVVLELAALQLPLFVAAPTPPEGVRLTLLQANLGLRTTPGLTQCPACGSSDRTIADCGQNSSSRYFDERR